MKRDSCSWNPFTYRVGYVLSSCPVKLNVMVYYVLRCRNSEGMIVIPEDHPGGISSQEPYTMRIMGQVFISVFLMEPDNLFPDYPLMPR